ncbi:HlyD family secretion protein [Picosynechococcus sp. NKBG15041c]|uniref:HlyD family secretion protein n=1 Tax=Picosynechococcus sp. NKBG15041c TaxID=1407650 RepID=UPI0004166D6B|nr:efflux RND transporter periplasmic adaptor subunit [Picosynechococcus sp. NKBG15041c]
MTTAPTTPKRSIPKILLIALPILLVGGFGVALVTYLLRPEVTQGIELSGRIEGYETNISAKVGGRIEAIAVREGDKVQKGQVLATLDSAELQASLDGAQARLNAAQQQVNLAQLQITVIENQIIEAQLTQRQAQDDTAGRVNAAQANVAAAQAQLAQAQAQVKQLEAELALAKADGDRFQELYESGVVSQQRLEQAQTQYLATKESLDARRAVVTAAAEQVKTAEGNLTQTQASQFNPDIRAVQVQRLQTQLAQGQAQLSAAQAQVQNAQANYNEIAAKLKDLELVSPIDGVVLTRTAEPGEVVAMGKTLLTLVNLEDVYLRGFIPEQEVGAIQIGQGAAVFLDSAPDEPLRATVAAIDTEASFTPENIYFRDDRVTQVFGLKLQIENESGFAKPGMPADATILTDATQNVRR